MRVIVRLVVGIFTLILLVAFAIYAYLTWNRTIDTAIPTEFEYCGKSIWGRDPEYLRIKDWLIQNREGWTTNWHTYYAGEGYYYPSYQIYVFDDFIAVSYKTDWGFPQYTKSIKHELEVNCGKGS